MSPAGGVIGLAGPTGCGKSGIALALAERLPAEIVNCDSIQLYKEFDCGSAKPRAEDFAKVPHHLYDVLSPNDRASAGRYASMARNVIKEIQLRHQHALLVGGSGLYFRALLSGLAQLDGEKTTVQEEVSKRESQLRSELGEKAAKEAMYQWLQSEDFDAAKMINPSDVARIRRALVVKLSGGRSVTEICELPQSDGLSCRLVVLLPPREILYRRIERRVDEMLEHGLVDEVVKLRTRWGDAVHAFESIGYRHVLEHLRGEYSAEEMRERIQRESRRYAKRQYTWWRHQPQALGWQGETILRDADWWRDESAVICQVQELFQQKTQVEEFSGVSLTIIEAPREAVDRREKVY